MKIDYSIEIPISNKNFITIINGLVFNCPSSTKKMIYNANNYNKKKNVYNPVSTRGNSFRNRGIDSNLLTTILSNMKKCLKDKNNYICLDKDGNVLLAEENLIKTSTLKDINFEYMIFKPHTNMVITESIYYYIRNSFAHGSFEYNKKSRTYKLECSSNGNIIAHMRLKESTLIEFVKLSKLNTVDIINLRTKKH